MGFVIKNDDSVAKMQKLLDYIFLHNISLGIGFKVDCGNCYSGLSFAGMIKYVLGKDYGYVLLDGEDKVEILNLSERYSLGVVYGRLSQAYDRGDVRTSPLDFMFAVSKNNLFVKNVKVAYSNSQNPYFYDCRCDRIIAIDRISNSLLCYEGGERAWSTPLQVNYSDSWKLGDTYTRPDSTFPVGLIGLYSVCTVYLYQSATGELYGKFKIKNNYIPE